MHIDLQIYCRSEDQTTYFQIFTVGKIYFNFEYHKFKNFKLKAEVRRCWDITSSAMSYIIDHPGSYVSDPETTEWDTNFLEFSQIGLNLSSIRRIRLPASFNDEQ